MNVESAESRRMIPFAEKLAEKNKSDTQEIQLSRDEILRLYSDYAGSVFNFFYYNTADREASSDLVNDVFVKVLDKGWRFDSRKGNMKVWLFTVARNTLRDYLRSRHRKKPYLMMDDAIDVPAPGCTCPHEKAELRSEIRALAEALTSLNRRERSLVSLKYGAGLRNKDIAGLVGLSEKNVGVILSRALSKLRKRMEDGR